MGNAQTSNNRKTSGQTGKIFCRYLLLILLMLPQAWAFSQGSGGNMVTYAGGSGNERFQGMLQLSDGTLLMGGQADNFDWVPNGVTVNTISNIGRYQSTSTQGTGFVMRLSADQQTILGVLRFPDNTVRDVYRIRTNSLPGQPTGDIFISGSRDTTAGSDGYYIARLDNNFVNGFPTGVAYYRAINARGRNGGGPSIRFPDGSESAHKLYQVWDVNSKGQILYASGGDFSFDATGVNFMNRNGVDTLMEYFSIHSPNYTGVPASSFVNTTGNPAFDLRSSSLWFKYAGTGTPGAMRSYSLSLFNQLNEDENGNPGRKGAYPFDAFFDSPQLLGGAPIVTTGPGYTGYSTNTGGGRWTGKIGGIVFDKRNGHFYMGFSISVGSVSNQANLDDTEPAVAAFTALGELKWWARLHKEDANRSSAQQQVEGLDLDYAYNQLVVLGRTRGNSINNFWNGNDLKEKPGKSGFQNQITGNISNSVIPDFFWLGKYDLNSGKIKHSTYVAELEANQSFSAPSANPNYDGFPDLNGYNFNLGTTIVNQISVHPSSGQIYIAGIGQRTLTTRSAYQKMLKPGTFQEGKGIAATNAFLRVYNHSLDTVVYSSLLTGIWNPVNGTSNNTVIRSVLPLNNGLFFTGFHSGQGGDIPLLSRPAWGSDTKDGVTALFGKLNFDPTPPPAQPDTIVRPAELCAGTEFTFSVPQVAGATSYLWVVEANGWSGSSTSNSITLTRAGNAATGFLTVYAINGSGISLARTTLLPANATVNAPTGFSFPPSQCPNQSQTYSVNPVNGALSYTWAITGTGCEAWSLSSNNTGSNSVVVSTGASVVSPCNIQVVANGCANSSSPAIFPLPSLGAVPNQPVFSTTDTTVCGGIPKVFSVENDLSAVSYQWTVSGTGFSGGGSGSSITVSAEPGATGGQLSVVALNQCGISSPATLSLGNASSLTLPDVPSSILGPNGGFCSDDTLSYSTPPAGTNTFNWYTNGNLWQVLDQGGNTTRLFIPQIGTSTQAFLFVQAKNVCGLSNPRGFLIRKGNPDIPGSERILPSLDSGICAGSTTTFSINPTFTATSYEWSFPNGWTINGPSNQNSVSVSVTGASEAGFIKVKAFNGCGYDSVQRLSPAIKTNTATFSVEPAPGGVITLCAGSSRLAYINGTFNGPVKSFQWIMPSGVFVLNASNTDPSSDTVRISSSFEATSGPIQVIMSGSECGVANLNLSITPNPAPGPISGSNLLCVNPANQTYRIRSIPGASSYTFEIQPTSAGTLVVSDTSVIIDWNDTFTGIATLRSRAVSSCGPSPFGPSFDVTLGLPDANVQGPASVCSSAPVQLVASGGSQYNWYSQATGGVPIATNAGTLNVNVNSDTTFYVTITNGTCESSNRTPVSILFGSSPSAPTVSGDTICTGGVVNLSAGGGPGGAVYNWYTSPSGGTPVFTGATYSPTISSSQSYYVSTAVSGCESSTRTLVQAGVINNTSIPVGIPDTICTAGQVTLTATGGGTGVSYNWYTTPTGGSPVFSGASYSPNITTTTSFYVSASDGNCESGRVAVEGVVGGGTSAPTSSDVAICAPGSITLVANGASGSQSYQWYDQPTGGTSLFSGSSYTISNLLATDTFYVSILDGSCESNRTRVIGRILPALPSASSNPVAVCNPGQVLLTATGAGSGQDYKWYDAASGGTLLGSGSPFSFNVTATVTVYVAVSEGACESPVRQPVAVTLNQTPAAPATTGASICGSGSVNLTANSSSPGVGLEWYDAASSGNLVFTGQAYSPTLTVSDTFYVEAVGTGGCRSGRTQVIATINPVPALPSGEDQARCGEGSGELTAILSGPGVLNWYTQASGGNPVFTGPTFSVPSTSATVSYFVSGAEGSCVGPRKELRLIINPLPDMPSGLDDSRCGPGSVTLSVTGSGEFTWFDVPAGGASVGSGPSFQTPNLTSGTSYYVSARIGSCESERKALMVAIKAIPEKPLSDTVERCGPGPVSLVTSAPGVQTIHWYTALTGGSLISSNATLTTEVTETKFFFAAGVSPEGCESERVLSRVTVIPIPQPNAVADPEIVKPGESSNLSSTGGGVYSWTPSATLKNSNTANPVASPFITTTYKVVVTFRGCVGSDSVTVQVDGAGDEIPNVFTPNNDGVFDTWIIPGALSAAANKLIIFNRWGNVVKEVNGYKNDWNGEGLPDGTYYYTYDDGKSTKTGTVTIIR